MCPNIFHPDTSPNTPSEDCSKTSTSSRGNSKTSTNSAPSNPNSAPMFSGYSWSCSRDGAAPVASDIKGCVVKVICDIKVEGGQDWWGMLGDGPGCRLVKYKVGSLAEGIPRLFSLDFPSARWVSLHYVFLAYRLWISPLPLCERLVSTTSEDCPYNGHQDICPGTAYCIAIGMHQ